MPFEIEKKFLVNSNDFKSLAFKKTRTRQGYLCSVPERTVRIRLKGDQGFITIKGMGNHSGSTRYEWEKPIPASEAEELLKICEPGIIDKTRYEVKLGEHVYEIDEFHGENDGLVIAEIELSSENETFQRPSWLGKEVTGDPKYYNAMLIKKPFTKW